jgi:AcrR family transcriptional regulator
MQDSKKKRGRPRAFDEQLARQQILEHFWEHGYAAASLDDLSSATGMARPSLYATFGNKESMYLSALELFKSYWKPATQRLLTCSEGAEGLREFFSTALNLYLQEGKSARGCFLICTATVEAQHSAAIQSALAQALLELDLALQRFFERFFEPALAASKARLAAALLHSLAVRARAGQARSQLENLLDEASLLLG